MGHRARVFGRANNMARQVKVGFYPKKWMLYRYVLKCFSPPATLCVALRAGAQVLQCHRVLDVGCGTGAALIDLKKLLGKRRGCYWRGRGEIAS